LFEVYADYLLFYDTSKDYPIPYSPLPIKKTSSFGDFHFYFDDIILSQGDYHVLKRAVAAYLVGLYG
jgi:hypothetical protein